MITLDETECSPEIVNCTIAGNSADYNNMGGAVCSYDATPTFRNCILWGDGDTVYPMGWEVPLTYSCIQGGYPGVGNISDDPLFVNGSQGDYYLSCRAAGQAENSPCIDAGSDTAEALGLDQLTTRTDCVPDGVVVDMGYHYPTTTGEGPVIECSLNDTEFSPGESLVALYDIDNPGPDITVDVYFAFVMPDGAILCISPTRIDFGIFACITDVFLYQGYSMEPTSLLSIVVPGGLPGGNYLFAGALSTLGQFGIIGDASLFEFTLRG